MRLYLVRHGETISNQKGLVEGQGQDNINFGSALSPNGVFQARCLANILANVPFYKLYMSPALRTRKTAKEIEEHNSFATIAINDSDLLETNFGIFEGTVFEKYKKKYPDLYKIDLENSSRVIHPEGESVIETYKRVCRVIDRIIADHCGKNVNILIVSHGGPLSMILIHIFNWNLDKMLHVIRWHNCGLTIIEWQQKYPRIICMNDISHLKSDHKLRLKSAKAV